MENVIKFIARHLGLAVVGEKQIPRRFAPRNDKSVGLGDRNDKSVGCVIGMTKVWGSVIGMTKVGGDPRNDKEWWGPRNGKVGFIDSLRRS